MHRNQIFLEEIRDSHGDEREMQYQNQFWMECQVREFAIAQKPQQNCTFMNSASKPDMVTDVNLCALWTVDKKVVNRLIAD
jgi:hypothetical protein